MRWCCFSRRSGWPRTGEARRRPQSTRNTKCPRSSSPSDQTPYGPTVEALDTTTAAVNSALQRAHAQLEGTHEDGVCADDLTDRQSVATADTRPVVRKAKDTRMKVRKAPKRSAKTTKATKTKKTGRKKR